MAQKESAPVPSSQRHPFQSTPAQNQQFSTHQNEHMSEEATDPSATQSSNDPKQIATSIVGLSPSENSIVLSSESQTCKQTTSAAASHVAAAGSSGVYVDESKLDSDSWPVTISSVDESNGIKIGSQTEPMSGPAPESCLKSGLLKIFESPLEALRYQWTRRKSPSSVEPCPLCFTISTSPPTPPMKNRVVNLNGETIQLLSNGISVAGTTLTVRAPPITVSGVPIYLDPSILLVGTPYFSLATNDPNPLSKTTAGHEITAAPSPLNFGGTTTSRGSPPMTIDGILISFENSGELVVGSKTITLEGPGLSLGGLLIGVGAWIPRTVFYRYSFSGVGQLDSRDWKRYV